ncbi:MAG TPA: dihydroxy-acid dehydratase [Anaerovoracaceae bacterium]|nr:dihydroxy-acid dehydratase [Anaerovoracaceae bacterium]
MSNSSVMRTTSAESDCLHYGMGWSRDDLSKMHIMIQSSYGESHPGSSHLLELSNMVRDGVLEEKARPCTFIVTDMCDGVAQGSLGNHYSLLSRDFIACMIEIQAKSTLCDGLVLLSSCDKSMPAHIIAAARLKMPTVLMPGGCMSAGASFYGCDRMWEVRRNVQSGKCTEEDFNTLSMGACPSAGACQQFGTAGTMQAMAEALGLAMPGTALIPAANAAIRRASREAGRHVCRLVAEQITAADILTKKALENAITVHAAIGGSANAIVHLLAIASEAGVDLSLDDFDRIHRSTPYLTNTLSTSKYPTELFWYAGAVPALMGEIRDLLHLDALTVTGRTLGENLDRWEKENLSQYNWSFLENYRIGYRDVINDREHARTKDGGVAVLRGNIAAGGAIVKHSAVASEMMHFQARVQVFDNENDAIDWLLSGKVRGKTIIAVLGQGPRANGMPEIFRLGDVIERDEELKDHVAVITDGRYSGCTKGPAIGYICPEAAAGGEIGKIHTGDLLEIDIQNRKLSLVEGEDEEGEILQGDALLARRQNNFTGKIPSVANDAFGIYRKLATQALCGGNMKTAE